MCVVLLVLSGPPGPQADNDPQQGPGGGHGSHRGPGLPAGVSGELNMWREHATRLITLGGLQ